MINFQNKIGILIHKDDYTDLKPLIERLKDFINNGIKLGRNKWALETYVLKSYDESELLNASLSYFHIETHYLLIII